MRFDYRYVTHAARVLQHSVGVVGRVHQSYSDVARVAVIVIEWDRDMDVADVGAGQDRADRNLPIRHVRVKLEAAPILQVSL